MIPALVLSVALAGLLDPPTVTCHLWKRLEINDTKHCIYRGPNRTFYTHFPTTSWRECVNALTAGRTRSRLSTRYCVAFNRGSDMTNAFEKILEYRLMPRFMMFTMTVVYIRVIEFAITVPELSTQHAAVVSVVTGAMTGAFATWLSSERT